jgi:hypothetical protein
VRRTGNRYVARIKAGEKDIYLGCYVNLDDAKSAYEAAAVKYHGEFTPIL